MSARAIFISLCLVVCAAVPADAGHGTQPQTAAAPADAGQDGATQPQTAAAGLSPGLDPGSSVSFDLTRGRFLRPLPFDVQFYLVSPVDNTVTAVSGRYARSCTDALDAGSMRAASLGRAILLPAVGTPARRSVELSVPALAPNRNYCFAFTMTLTTDEAKLREIVIRELNERLMALYGNEQLLTGGTPFDDFRRAILSGIRDAAHELQLKTGMTLRLTVPNDSFFAEPPPAAGVPPPTVPDARPVIQARPGVLATSIDQKERLAFARLLTFQRGKANAVSLFENRVALGTNEFARLRALPAFQRMVSQLRTNLAQPLVSQRVTQASLAFATADPSLDAAQASGVDVTNIASANNPDRVWNPEDLESRVTILDATITALNDFRQLAADLSTSSWEPLRDVAGLGPQLAGKPNPNAVSAAEFVAVAQQAERVRQALLEARGALTNLQRVLTERTALITSAAAGVTADVVEVIQVDGTSVASWETRARSYVSADVGVVWSQPIESFFFYVGANFYLGPVNKKAPLRWSEPGNFRKRFSFTAGIPINSFDDTQSQATLAAGDVTLTGVLGDRPLLLGAGLRLTDLVRVTSGTVLFRVRSPDPLVTDEALDYAWYLALSIDWDLKGMFSQIGSASPAPSSSIRPRAGF